MTSKICIHLLASILLFLFFSCKQKEKQVSAQIYTANNVSIENNYSYAILVSKNGELVFEEYYNQKTKDSLCNVQSLTKGIMSVLIGIAVDKGYIKSVDEPIVNYFPTEFETLSDSNKRSITIKHVLNQTSGLAWKGYLEHGAWLQSEDPIGFVLKKPLLNAPGTTYNYNSGATHLLSAIISRTTGISTAAFANKVLFTPLRIDEVDWQRRNDGHYDGSGLGLKMKPMDLMKIGLLLENKGRHNGVSLISETWVNTLFDPIEKKPTQWGLKNSSHGYCWYKATLNGDLIDYGMGYGGQFIIMVPAKKLIVVSTHNHDTPNGIEQQIEFLNVRLPKLIDRYGS
ncbi:class C beta-lactamase-related serine hydrolase [Flagellimonas alvinocaridis]|uniref:Class C beta-lactamase-related serine hydrolase n=1 Tax=Flagellimonas alvinocaridis TaxID=2530200 RepID=A0A4S8RSQ8_9FLAO|nr:serine hydrolase [Allomuricauda alvinocaridis]THV61032.1 class C beta-lactamase-related serine hydrolase [Allomuricauda alvinocaridis]